MPIFEQGYRAYTGEVRKGSRALAIAWESFRPRMRWWVWLVAFVFMWWPFLILGGVTYLVLMQGLPMTLPAQATAATAFSTSGPLQLPRFISAMNGSDGWPFWEVLNDAFAATGPVVLPAIACAGILSSDRRTGALQIYFARPVTRLDYLAGKMLAVAAFCSILTALPTLALWVECAALQTKLSYVGDTWYVPFAVLGASALYTLWSTALILFVSSLLDRPVLIGTIVIFGYLFLLGLGEVLSHSLDDKRWLALVPHYALGGLTAPLFGLALPDWLPLHLCVPMGLAMPALWLLVAVRRLRAVEVVT